MARRVGFTSALSRVWYWALVVGAYSAVPVVVGVTPWIERFDPVSIIDAIIALILGFILMFRINRAYERWWEARTLWGKLVNVSRNLAIKAKTLTEPDDMERRRLRTLIVGFSSALKLHLRGRARLAEVPGFESTADEPDHVPGYVVEQLYGVFSAWRSAGRIAAPDLWVLDREAREFLEIGGGCERIQNTLMSQSFPSLARQALVLYLLYLPWSLAPDYGAATIPMVIVATYFVIAAEGIAHYVERPFGQEDDHLDLDSICAGIDASVSEILER
jgi:putative membrane protein